jgi:Replication-relaxation
VSGRKHLTTRPAAGPLLAALAGLTDDDWQVCRVLADHQVLTTSLLATLLGVRPRTLQQRLATLTTLNVVERFRPHQPLGAGSAPYHYLLGEAGVTALTAADGSGPEGLGWDRARLGGLAHANGRLTHQLEVNTLLGQLTHTARQQRGTQLVCWWPAHRCQARWGRLITPDAYARWRDPDGEVDFFLHHHPAANPPAVQPDLTLEGYNDLAAATAITTPVLIHTSDPGRKPAARPAGRPTTPDPGGHQQPGLRAAHPAGVAAHQQPRWRHAVSARRARPPRPLAARLPPACTTGGVVATAAIGRRPPG